MSKLKYERKGAKFTPARQRPLTQRRTDCAGCDAYALCRDTGSAWLCSACEHDREALTFADTFAPS